MSNEQNAENINQTIISLSQEKELNQANKIEENKSFNQINQFEQYKTNSYNESQNREFHSKFSNENKDISDEIKLKRKEAPDNSYCNIQNESNFSNNQYKNNFYPNFTQQQYNINFSNFSNENFKNDLNKIENNRQLKSNFSDTNDPINKLNQNQIQNQTQNVNDENKNNYTNNQIQNNAIASNYWKMRFSMNSSLYNRIMKEDENLIQEHVYNQKKKDTLNVSNYKNIDIDITYKSQKIVERSEFVYFSDITDLDPTLKANLTILNFTLMTPIQREVIKFIRNGSDVMGCSQTGTGKTIAFLLPIISRMLNEMPSPLTCNPPSPRLLILIPTRELAEQIFTEARKIVNKTGIVVNKIYGGVPHDEQLEKMYSGCDILVATPGRLLDFIEKKNLSLKNVKYLIMDEADRMLDMGFQPQLMKIAFGCDLMPKNLRQNLLFSATFTEEIKNISKNFMNEDHYFIQTIFDKNPSKNIKQELYYATETDKIDKLHEILKNTSGSIIIFVETKFGVDNLYLALKKFGHRVSCIHGDKKQQQRQEAIKRFSMGQISILIATDIASRGLDFPRVTHVINFDLPTNIEDYIHRIGRTGRCGNTGTAISFVNEYNKPIIKNLYYFMKKNHQKISEWFENLYKNCKDINVNIFDRIPKKPKRTLGLFNKTYTGNDSNTDHFSQTMNYMQNRNMSNNTFSNANYMNTNFANYGNNQATFPNINNFTNPIPPNSFDKTTTQIDNSSNYEKKDKYDTRREFSSYRNENPITSDPYKKFSGSTSYNPDSDHKLNNTNERYSKDYNKDTSKDYKNNRDYSKDYNRDSSRDYKKDYNKSDSTRDVNKYEKYESKRDNTKGEYKSNDYSRGSTHSKKYESYDSRDRHSSSKSDNGSSNHQFLGKKHPYPESTQTKDDEESSYQKNRRSRFDENKERTEYNNRSSNFGDKKDNDHRGSNYTNVNKSSNFGYNPNQSNDFSSNSNPNAMNSRDNYKRYNHETKKDNSMMPNITQNSMYSQYPGMPLNYMYPQMAYSNYYNQNNNKPLISNQVTTTNNNQDSTNNPNNNLSNTNETNPSETTNSTSTVKQTTNITNPYSAYYNYAAAYSSYGYAANLTGYDPYNGQVYDSLKYMYPQQNADSNSTSNKKIENKTNEEE